MAGICTAAGSEVEEDAGNGVEEAGAEVAGEVQDVEEIAGVGRVDLALERESYDEHREDGDEEESGADPLLRRRWPGPGMSHPAMRTIAGKVEDCAVRVCA